MAPVRSQGFLLCRRPPGFSQNGCGGLAADVFAQAQKQKRIVARSAKLAEVDARTFPLQNTVQAVMPSGPDVVQPYSCPKHQTDTKPALRFRARAFATFILPYRAFLFPFSSSFPLARLPTHAVFFPVQKQGGAVVENALRPLCFPNFTLHWQPGLKSRIRAFYPAVKPDIVRILRSFARLRSAWVRTFLPCDLPVTSEKGGLSPPFIFPANSAES